VVVDCNSSRCWSPINTALVPVACHRHSGSHPVDVQCIQVQLRADDEQLSNLHFDEFQVLIITHVLRLQLPHASGNLLTCHPLSLLPSAGASFGHAEPGNAAMRTQAGNPCRSIGSVAAAMHADQRSCRCGGIAAVTTAVWMFVSSDVALRHVLSLQLLANYRCCSAERDCRGPCSACTAHSAPSSEWPLTPQHISAVMT
jgi:hypothetical protein